MKHTTRQRRKTVFDVVAELEELVSDPTLRPYNFLEAPTSPTVADSSRLITVTPVASIPVPSTPVSTTVDTKSGLGSPQDLKWKTTSAILSSLAPFIETTQSPNSILSLEEPPSLSDASSKSREEFKVSAGCPATPVSTTPVSSALGPSYVDTVAADDRIGAGRRAHPLRIREARLVQDGHSASEQVVYDYLWRAGKPQNEQLRTIRTGVVSVAKNLGMSDSTVKAAVEGLLDKLAIERGPSFSWTMGYEYRILSWAACLAKRKAAGLTHVIKSKGVVFVNPTSGKQLTFSHFPGKKKGPSTMDSTTLDSMGANGSGALTLKNVSTLENSEPRTPESTDASYGHLKAQHTTITMTNVRDALSKYSQTDEIGIRALISAVQQNAPDATWEELEFFISQKGEIIKKNKINNPFGFLLVTVPRAFENPAFQSWRKNGGEAAAGIASRLQEASHKMQMLRQHCEAVLADSNSSAAQTTEAKALLEAME